MSDKKVRFPKRIPQKYKWWPLVLLITGIAFWQSLSFPLFQAPYSTVVTSVNGRLLGAHIASDQQWRFPKVDSLPANYKKALLQYEDKRFYRHPGIDPLAVARALINNIKHGHIVSGASTITMQTIRLSRKSKPRTYLEKIIETILALRLEISRSKDEILQLYASHAPFGGNIVGIRAAAYRYFGRNPHHLSWAEAAALAVLPNSPGLIHPGRSRKALRQKRNSLLHALWQDATIDSTTYALAIDEPIPQKAKPFQQHAYHLTMRYTTQPNHNPKGIYQTTIAFSTQRKLNALVQEHAEKLRSNGIYNMAALVLDTESGQVLGYTGNTPVVQPNRHGYSVDIIRAPRSTGSVLKPFLYASMLSGGELLPYTLVPDIPVRYGSFAPQNYNLGYDGAIPADQALARSLNVPAVHMLEAFGQPRFYKILKQSGISTLNMPPEHYGLSLILGGCEGTLWEITGMYASLGRTLLHYPAYNSRYHPKDVHPPHLAYSQTKAGKRPKDLRSSGLYSASGIWYTLQAMQDVERPQSEINWKAFSSSRKLAWKTGTSFGFRDAWAIGITPQYTVGIWAGNASGEGRPGLIGVKAAAPLLFDVFNMLPAKNTWFPKPEDDLEPARVCPQSGHLASPACPAADTLLIPVKGNETIACPYHKTIHLNADSSYRVNSMCISPAKMAHASWFVLPPAQEWFYAPSHPEYYRLPPMHPNCRGKELAEGIAMMEMLYPFKISAIYLPRELSGERGKVVFQAAHRRKKATIFWHIDGVFAGRTKGTHKIAAAPDTGWHVLKLTDRQGHTLKRKFRILSADD